MKYLRTSIGKLIVFICFSLLITILPLFLILHGTFKQFGKYACTNNARQIKDISHSSLSALATAQAQKYDEIFTRIKVAASLLALASTDIYSRLGLLGQMPLEAPPLVKQETNQIFFTPPSHPIVTTFWGNTKISPAIDKEIKALSHLGPYLKATRELINESLATHVITESGIGLYYTTNPMVKNQYFNLPPAKEYDLRKKETKAKGYSVQWTNPHKNDDIEGLMVTANASIVDDTGNFLGIAGIDIPITSIVSDLTWKEAKENRDPGAILFSFIMDKNGNLIAFPQSCFDLFSLGTDPGEFKYSRDILNKNLVDSRNPAIRKAAKQILDSPGSLLSIKLHGDTYILAASRLSETGWHLVLVSREKDLLSSVHQTRKELEKSLAQISGYYLKYCALIIALAILFIFLAFKIIIRPIKQLTALTLKVSEGDLSMGSQVSSKNEIGELAAAFNQIIAKISLSEKSKTSHALALENRIDQLKGLNEHLVFSEEMERKSIAADLHDSLAQTLAIGISKIKNMTEPDTPINPEDLLKIQGVLEQAIIEIRSLIYKLSPPILDDFDIDIAIGFLVEETNEQHHTNFTYINNLEEPIDLNEALKVTLYRATGELISNILKHAKTQTAEFEISATRGNLYIRVEDEGCGMEVKRIEEIKGCGFGLYRIMERMENFDGRLDIFSKPDQGTKIILTAPII